MNAATPEENPYPVEPLVDKGNLPDPFAWPDGSRVETPADWPARAAAWRKQILDLEYGGFPPAPKAVEIESLCHSRAARLPGLPPFYTYRLHCLGGEKPIAFSVQIVFPKGDGPFPAIIEGDRCWWFLQDEVAARVIESGCALVLFNRTELAEDVGYSGAPDPRKRSGGLYDAYPGRTFGALSAWAWGYHRCVDLLEKLPFIDAARIAVTGLSRGGKTALLAGAVDERIALVNDNASCAAGAPLFRYVGHGGETLNIANVFPSWFGPNFHEYVGREETLPFDQHCLLASVAPRPLLLTFARDDRWSNPEGMVLSVAAARPVYRFLDAPDNIAFHLRAGGHAHTLEDWNVLLDFIGWKWQNTPPKAPYNRHPYTHLRTAFPWSAPGK